MSNDKYQKGLEIRTQVLGEEYVNRSLQNADEFTKPLQDLVTEYCWGMSGAVMVCRSKSAA